MVTTATSTRAGLKKETRVPGGSRFPRPNGKGPGGNGHKRRDDDSQFSSSRYRVMMWVVLAAIVMMFAALSSAYIVLSGGDQWKPIRVPRMFFLSTVLLVVSSFTFAVARRRLNEEKRRAYVRWLAATLFLGLGFLATQLMAWGELRGQGVYLKSNPHSAFFYLFTGVHGVHLIGGVLALLFLVLRSIRNQKIGTARVEASVSAVSLYWHAMDGLWVWLFILLLVWR